MKEKIRDFLNDYYVDLKKYYKNTIKILKKPIRLVRYHWNNPKSILGKKLIPKINKFCLKLSNIFENIFLKSKYRRRNLLVTGSLIIVCLFLLVLYPSFAFYQNNYEFDLIGGVVGDMYANQFDYSLLIYIEETNSLGEGTGTYKLTSEIPTFNYVYSGFKCNNNSTLKYDETTAFTSVTLNQKDICSIYFDLLGSADISIQIMVEETINSNSYKISNFIPYFGYKYSHYECDNNSYLTYNSELHKVSVETSSKEYCQVYFKKEEADIDIKLFIESTHNSQNYIERLSIPSNKEYQISNNTICFNENNERVEIDISYTDGYIQLNPLSISYCNVYLDLKNE